MIENFRLRKSAAGKVLKRTERRRHWVTPKGKDKKVGIPAYMELLDEDNGIRYKLSSMNAETAARIRGLFEANMKKELDEGLELQNASIGEDKFQVLGLRTDEGFRPAFKVIGIIGVTDKFKNLLIESMSSKRNINTLDAVILAGANKIGITPGQLVGKEPHPFTEYDEPGYGARFHMCSTAVAAAYKKNAARLNNK